MANGSAFFGEMMSRRALEDLQEMKVLEDSGAYARRDVNAVEQSFRLTYLPFFNNRKTAEALDFGFTALTAENAPGTEMRMFRELQTRDPIGNLARISARLSSCTPNATPLPEAWTPWRIRRSSSAL